MLIHDCFRICARARPWLCIIEIIQCAWLLFRRNEMCPHFSFFLSQPLPFPYSKHGACRSPLFQKWFRGFPTMQPYIAALHCLKEGVPSHFVIWFWQTFTKARRSAMQARVVALLVALHCLECGANHGLLVTTSANKSKRGIVDGTEINWAECTWTEWSVEQIISLLLGGSPWGHTALALTCSNRDVTRTTASSRVHDHSFSPPSHTDRSAWSPCSKTCGGPGSGGRGTGAYVRL